MLAMRISQAVVRGLATQYEFMRLTGDNEFLSLKNFEENIMVFGFFVQNT